MEKKWISVDKKLPKPDEFVLIYEGRDSIKIGRNDGTFWFEYESPYLSHNITYWMELPEPPKKNCCDPDNGCLCNK